MSNYVQSHLSEGEHVLFEAHYNGCIWIKPIIVFLLFSVPLFVVLFYTPSYEFADNINILVLCVIMFLIGLWGLIRTYIKIHTDEIAITNQRLIAKFGVISRRTKELNLLQVETISVEQDIFSRIFGAGDVIVKGTGLTNFPLHCIDKPYDFRTAFQNVLVRHLSSHINDGSGTIIIKNTAEVGSSTECAETPKANNNSITGKSESLIKLKSLLDSGILSQEEFDNEKKKILNS